MIRIFVTGGTFDKEYNELNGELFFKETHLPEMLKLGSALAFAQTLPAGVYVAMNGRYFLWNNVRKNKQTGEFEELK